MSREVENLLLLLIGVCTAVIAVTGNYANYVKPSLFPWLLATAALLIVLALCAIDRDVVTRLRGEREHEAGHDGHDPHAGHDKQDAHHDGETGHVHRARVGWLLLVPIVLMAVVVPPALGGRQVSSMSSGTSRELVKSPFSALPAGRAPEVSLSEVVTRANLDSAGTLDDRLITVVGYVLNEADGMDLGKVVIICCAADARLARVHLRGMDGAASFADDVWLRVEGVVSVPDGATEWTTPTLTATSVQEIDEPARPYAY